MADGVTASVITATVSNGQTPEQGVELTFSTTMGSLSSTTADSNSVGRALVTLTSMNAGVAIVTCKTILNDEETEIINSVAVTFTKFTPDPELNSFVLSVDPPTVPPDNLTPSKVSAQLYDKLGSPLSQPGVTVNFTTAPVGLAHFANNRQTIAINTDDKGNAIALIYSPVPGVATVDATIGSLDTEAVFVNFSGEGFPAFISLSANPTRIPADGYSYAAITAVILDSGAKPVAPGTPVTFLTTSPGIFENGKKSYSTVTVDDTGTITVRLRAENTVSTGRAMITCTAGSAPPQTVYVEIVSA